MSVEVVGRDGEGRMKAEARLQISVTEFLMCCTTEQLKNELARRELETREQLKNEKKRMKESMKYRLDIIKGRYDSN